MKIRDQYIKAVLFKNPDRIPLSPGGPRESTLAAWKKQGLPENANYHHVVTDKLGIPRNALLSTYSMPVSFKMIPEFQVKILDHKDGHYLISDWMGAITEISDQYNESYLRSAKDFVTRKWHKFPVENRSDWERMKTRYNPNDSLRIPNDLTTEVANAKLNDKIVTLYFNGIFWQLREWCGFENLCLLMADDPVFVSEMAEFWGDFVSKVLEKVLKIAVPDKVLISEDMAYKAHSMISPAMTRHFILPAYKKWVPMVKKAGVELIELDSDGYVEELIPVWIEAGINCCSPMEVAAYNDIFKCRELFGTDMAYMQGIDKRLIAKGGKDLSDHVSAICKKMFEKGGYIPGCDHAVPPDISFQNYIEFTRLLAMFSGWL